MRHTAGIAKAKTLVGWEPVTSFEAAMEQTIAWYRDNQTWWENQVAMRRIPIITASGKQEMH